MAVTTAAALAAKHKRDKFLVDLVRLGVAAPARRDSADVQPVQRRVDGARCSSAEGHFVPIITVKIAPVAHTTQARASHYQQLPSVSALESSSCNFDTSLPGIRNIIHGVVREEIRKLLPAISCPTFIMIAEIVSEQVRQAFQLETSPATRLPRRVPREGCRSDTSDIIKARATDFLRAHHQMDSWAKRRIFM
ncbi:hypothetical protein HPB47_022354 [Ixodes persulcatus]|uniref:Uncharacterized protein n=1 Tax=Ixodes persulcatus TaxID=34615 RepID=A0AC60QD93_IXOPE|nr:hypothetical protein HPB47_022354 [Ixodes persulcatus]